MTLPHSKSPPEIQIAEGPQKSACDQREGRWANCLVYSAARYEQDAQKGHSHPRLIEVVAAHSARNAEVTIRAIELGVEGGQSRVGHCTFHDQLRKNGVNERRSHMPSTRGAQEFLKRPEPPFRPKGGSQRQHRAKRRLQHRSKRPCPGLVSR